MATFTVNYAGNVWRGGKSSVRTVIKTTAHIKLRITFRDRQNHSAIYDYYRAKIGDTAYYHMWDLAKAGVGLNTYINKYIYNATKV